VYNRVLTADEIKTAETLWEIGNNVHRTIKQRFKDVNPQTWKPKNSNREMTLNVSGLADLDTHLLASWLHKGMNQQAHEIDAVITHNVAMALVNYMNGMTMFNDKDAVAKLFGLKEAPLNSEFTKLAFKYADKPTTTKKAANDIGMDIITALGIEVSKDIDKSMKRRLATAFGTLALAAGLNTKMGRTGAMLEMTSVPVAEFRADNLSINGKATVAYTIRTMKCFNLSFRLSNLSHPVIMLLPPVVHFVD
jgi:hypothetical protein